MTEIQLDFQMSFAETMLSLNQKDENMSEASFNPDKHVDNQGKETGQTNALRAIRASTALEYYDHELVGAEGPVNWLVASELIADLAHWCDRQGADIKAVIGLGLRDWMAER